MKIPSLGRLLSVLFGPRVLGFILYGGIGFLILGLLTPRNGGHTRAALTAGTENSMHQIETAFLNYQVEYETSPSARDQSGFIKNLLGDNPRQIAFLSLKARDQDAEGHMLDRWGTPFCITILDSQDLQILSAGPDKIWQTSDDLSLHDVP